MFVPAYDQGNAPFRAWAATVVWTTVSWGNSGGLAPNLADFAIIEVRDQVFREQGRKVRKRIGDVTGYLGYRTHGLLPNHTKQLGYPANHDFGEIMHQVDSQHFVPFDQGTVLYGNDMGGGSSGGPWVENFGSKAVGQTDGLAPFPNSVVGVTSFGFVPPPRLQALRQLDAERRVPRPCASRLRSHSGQLLAGCPAHGSRRPVRHLWIDARESAMVARRPAAAHRSWSPPVITMPSIYVCNLMEMAAHAEALQASHLVSLVSPDEQPATPACIAIERHHRVGIHDISEPWTVTFCRRGSTSRR